MMVHAMDYWNVSLSIRVPGGGGGGGFGVFKHPLWVNTGIGVFKHSPLDLVLVLACLLVREVGDVLLDTPTHTWKIDHQILTKEKESVGSPPPPPPPPPKS